MAEKVESGAALVEVADQQVGAAGVAQIPNFREQVSSGLRIGGAAGAQMVAAGVDQGRAVGGRDAQSLRFGHAGIAFDRVHSRAEAAGVVEDEVLRQRSRTEACCRPSGTPNWW